MESASKIHMSNQELSLIVRQYLKKELTASSEISDGWFNTIYVLTLSDASKVCIKISPPTSFVAMRYEKNLLDAEIEVQTLLHNKGFRVPRILARSSNLEHKEYSWFLYEFLPGLALGSARKEMSQETQARADSQVAAQTAKIHSLVGSRFGRWHEDATVSQLWSRSFTSMIMDLFADAVDKSVDLPIKKQVMLEILSTAQADLDMVQSPRLVLWDLHDANVIVDPATGELGGFLDPDRSLWGDPLMDFYFRDLANVSETWLKQYENVFATNQENSPRSLAGASRRMALYEVYLGLVMLIEVYYRGFSKDHEDWTRDYLKKALKHCKKQGLLPE